MTIFDENVVGSNFQSENLDLQIEDAVVQKRNHFRLTCNIPINFRLLHDDDSGYLIPDEPQGGTICNISGGGLKLLSNAKTGENDYILIFLDLNGIAMQLMGEIRVAYQNPDSMFPYQYGVMFCGISDTDQCNIVRYLFQQQTTRAYN